MGKTDGEPPPLMRQVFHAVECPNLDTDSLVRLCEHIEPRGVERGIARWRTRLPNLVWNEAVLEGSPFTLPDVFTVLDGGSPAGYSEYEVDQIIDLSQAANLVIEIAHVGPAEPSDGLSSAMNRLIVAHEVIEPGVLRGEGQAGGQASVNVMGDVFWPTPPGAELRAAFNTAMGRVSVISHPLARGAAWAALGTYHQFYSNGNKRTSRYVMNAVLLSHGFDAVLTPASRRGEYNQKLRDMFICGDLTNYATFLIKLYDDSSPAIRPR